MELIGFEMAERGKKVLLKINIAIEKFNAWVAGMLNVYLSISYLSSFWQSDLQIALTEAFIMRLCWAF